MLSSKQMNMTQKLLLSYSTLYVILSSSHDVIPEEKTREKQVGFTPKHSFFTVSESVLYSVTLLHSICKV
jgi:hypothetical protein